MANDYYTHGSFPADSSFGSSAQMRSELDTITAGFDKLPALTGNAYRVPFVNAASAALTVGTSLYTNSTGSLGVGTASPGAKLEVSGASNAAEIRIRSTDATPANIRAYVNAAEVGKLAFLTGNILSVETGGSERVRIDGSGNVGVGHSSPAVQLSVGSGASNAAIRVNGPSAPGVEFNDSGTAIRLAGGNTLALFTSGLQRVTLDNNGNLGVGGSPSFRLDVQQSQNGDSVTRIFNGDAGPSASANTTVQSDAATLNLFANSSGNTSGGVAALAGVQVTTNTPLGFWTNNSERLRIAASGGVVFTPMGAPASPSPGEMYYDNTTNKHYGWNGSSWNAFY